MIEIHLIEQGIHAALADCGLATATDSAAGAFVPGASVTYEMVGKVVSVIRGTRVGGSLLLAKLQAVVKTTMAMRNAKRKMVDLNLVNRILPKV